MKYIAFLIVLLIPFCLFSQDILLSYQKDSIWNDSLQDYQVKFVLIDTSGDVQSGNFQVKYTTMDSTDFVVTLYQKSMSSYNRLGDLEGAKISFLQYGNAYRLKAAEVVGVDEYRQYVMPIVRESMTGTYAIRYGQNIHRIDLQANGVARDAEGTLIMTHAPMSTTWTTVVYRVGQQENIQCYQIQPGVWLGDGTQGRLIMRKI